MCAIAIKNKNRMQKDIKFQTPVLQIMAPRYLLQRYVSLTI